MTKKNAIKQVCKLYNLSEECINLEMEFVQHWARRYYALVLQHFESDQSFLVLFCSDDKDVEIIAFKGITNENRRKKLCEYIEA